MFFTKEQNKFLILATEASTFLMPKNYELIEHTADIGIKVKGNDLAGLFKNAALALFDIIAERQPGKNTLLKTIPLSQAADDLEELFIDWLNELLSLSATEELIFTDVHIDALDERSLRARAVGEEDKYFTLKVEMKAATYHGLKIEKTGSGWEASFIIDV
jgi:SHS2 domain-containing protein